MPAERGRLTSATYHQPQEVQCHAASRPVQTLACTLNPSTFHTFEGRALLHMRSMPLATRSNSQRTSSRW